MTYRKFFTKTALYAILSCTVLILPGCSAITNDHTQSSSLQPDMARVFDGSKQAKSSDGHIWTPPAGSYTDEKGTVLDKNGVVIGQIGPVRIDPNAVG